MFITDSAERDDRRNNNIMEMKRDQARGNGNGYIFIH